MCLLIPIFSSPLPLGLPGLPALTKTYVHGVFQHGMLINAGFLRQQAAQALNLRQGRGVTRVDRLVRTIMVGLVAKLSS